MKIEPLVEILSLPEGSDRTIRLVAWIQGLYENPDAVPILVGGAAVELYTGGGYATGDLDFVGSVPPSVARRLRKAGFQKSGRHWFHEKAKLFVEFPSSCLENHERVVSFVAGDISVRIISPEDLLIDRLASWKFWNYAPDGINAALLYRARKKEMDRDRLTAAAEAKGVADALYELEKVMSTLPEGKAGDKHLEAWARKKK